MPSIRTKAIFLDRDGVLNRALLDPRGRPLPPRSRGEFVVLPGVPDACRRLKQAGYMLICVTNQPDIKRGTGDVAFISWINDTLRDVCGLDEVRMCPHDDEDGCSCRKPLPGMMVDAAAEHALDLSTSFMVGDRFRDIDAGHAAGCRTIFIDYDYPERAPQAPPEFTVANLGQAADYILARPENTGSSS